MLISIFTAHRARPRRQLTRGRRPATVVLVVVGLCAVSVPVTALDTSPSALLANPDHFDGQNVTTSGTITNLRERISQRGNPYYTFDLSDGLRAVRVFSFGHRPCRDGSPVGVTGRFYKEHRVGRYVFSDEITATSIRCQ